MLNPQLEQHLLEFDQEDDDHDEGGSANATPGGLTIDGDEDAPISSASNIHAYKNNHFAYSIISRHVLSAMFRIGLPLAAFLIGYLVQSLDHSVVLQLFLTGCTVVISVFATMETHTTHSISENSNPTKMAKTDDDNDLDHTERTLIAERCMHQVRLDRTRIARLLGKLGAPPLPVESDFVDTTHCTTDESLQQDLESFLLRHVELIEQIDGQLEMIQAATRLQFGMGISSVNSARGVDRIERAMLGRQMRQKQGNGNLALSFGTLRKRLHQILTKQCACLESLAFLRYEEENKTAKVTINDNGPITLTTLRQYKLQILQLLTDVTSNFVEAPTNDNWDTLRLCCDQADESTAYMETWPTLQNSTSKYHDEHSSVESKHAIFDLYSLIELVQGLKTALLALEGEEETQEVEKWWQRVVAVTHSLAACVEHRDNEYYKQHINRSHGMSEEKRERDDGLDKVPTLEKGEFSAEAIDDHAQMTMESKSQQPAFPESKQKCNQTFVFATGNNDCDDERRLLAQTRPKMVTDFMDPEEMLLAELENRLHAMPLTEEITVTEQNCSDQDQAQSKGRASHSSLTDKSQVMSMMPPGQAAIQFQGELAASLANFAAQADGDSVMDSFVD